MAQTSERIADDAAWLESLLVLRAEIEDTMRTAPTRLQSQLRAQLGDLQALEERITAPHLRALSEPIHYQGARIQFGRCPECSKPRCHRNTATGEWLCRACGAAGKQKGTM